MSDTPAMVFVVRERGGQIILQGWHADEDQADVLTEGLTERLGTPIEGLVPSAASEQSYDQLVAEGLVVMVDPGGAGQ